MNIAFVTNQAENCGVHQLGGMIVEALVRHSRHRVHVFEMSDEDAYLAALAEIGECDIALYNFHGAVLPFVTPARIRGMGMPAIGLLHEYDYETVHAEAAGTFRYRIAPDPSVTSRNPGLWTAPRIVPQIPINREPAEKLGSGTVTIGSFGFASPGKNFPEIVEFAKRSFARARVRLHIPPSHYCDSDGGLAREVFDACLKAAAGKVEVEVSSRFLSDAELVAFLGENDLNVFLYDDQRGRGISSVIDIALAAEKPIALSDCDMFRHMRVFAPEFFLSVSSVDRMLERGAATSRALKAIWTPEAAAKIYDDIFGAVMDDWGMPRGKRRNTMLSPIDLERRLADERLHSLPITKGDSSAPALEPAVEKAPESPFGTKASVLLIGAPGELARHRIDGHKAVAGLGEFTSDHASFHLSHNGKRFYDRILAIAAARAVHGETAYFTRIADLLAPGGTAVIFLTCGDDETDGSPLPKIGQIATQILSRAVPFLEDCRLVDAPDWFSYRPELDSEEYRNAAVVLAFRKGEHLSGETVSARKN